MLASAARRHRKYDLNGDQRPAAAQTHVDKGAEQLSRLKAKQNHNHQQDRSNHSEENDNSQSEHSEITHSKGRRFLKKDTAIRTLQYNPKRQQVLVTLPQPTLVSPQKRSTLPKQKVPSLLSGSAQENLERAAQQQQQLQQQPRKDDDEEEIKDFRRRAPKSPGDDDDASIEDTSPSLRSAFQRPFPKKTKKRKRITQASKHPPLDPETDSEAFAPLPDISFASTRRQSFMPLDMAVAAATAAKAARESAPDDDRRISNFHIECSDSSFREDDDIHHSHVLPNIQLDPRNIIICVVGFIIVLVVCMGALFAPAPAEGGESLVVYDGSTTTLEVVRARGFVKCGLSPPNNNNKRDDLRGFSIEQCRAMALAALGNATKYEEVSVQDIHTRFELLANGTIDIITEGTTYTM